MHPLEVSAPRRRQLHAEYGSDPTSALGGKKREV